MAGPDWLTKPTLDGELVQLRPIREHDFPSLGTALGDPEVLRLTGSVHTRAELTRAPVLDEVGLAWYRSRNEAPDRLDLAIVEHRTASCVGEAVLNEYDAENASCNFRILIGPQGRDRGLGTEATRLLVEYGLGVLGLHRIELGVYAFNPRALRAYEKAGFRVEGVSRESFRFDDEWVDTINMSVLSTDDR